MRVLFVDDMPGNEWREMVGRLRTIEGIFVDWNKTLKTDTQAL